MYTPFSLRKIRAYFVLRLAIIRAEAEYLRTGNRHYVIPSSTGHRLLVTSSIEETHRQGLRHSRDLHRPDYTNPNTLMRQAFYYTESRKSKTRWIHAMPRNVREVRRRLFYRWYCDR